MDRSLGESTLRSGREQSDPEDRASQQRRPDQTPETSRAIYQTRGCKYHLNSSQTAILKDLGAFRTITAESLSKYAYRGDENRFKKDLRDLTDQRLITVQSESRSRPRYITLTTTGKGVTEDHLRTNPNQVIYSGIVKKRELRHDSAIYDVYQKEAEKISKSGGIAKRVVLDFELKKNINRQLAKIQTLSLAERERLREEIADAHGLKIIKGKIQIPDLRVEYESQEHDQCKVDLECVTGHYKARQIAAKTAAGFKLYNQDYRGRSAERGEDLVGEVISL